MADSKPAQIGRYKILDELGRGGFGRVYRAYDPTVGRPVAIKILTQVSSDMLTRFRNEAIVAGSLRHENIVTVYEYGTHEDVPFLAMEYLEGDDLHEIIASHRHLTLLEKCTIMSQVAEGLHCAHRNGIIHRDVKPANVMVLRDGAVKIMDFGIARLTRDPEAIRLTLQGYMIGTLPYMAPEQLGGADCDALCDIFAYGVIFYELLTGRHPFEAPDAPSMMYKLTFDEAPSIRQYAPDLPQALADVVAKIIHKDREVRYQTLKDVQFDTEPIRIELQRERAGALLSQAQELASKEQLEPALKVVREALELDSTNRVARALREDLQRQLHQRTLLPRIESSLSAGEEHLTQRRFSEAAHAFESALRLDRDNAYIQQRIEQARALVEHAQRASQLLAQAKREFEEQKLTAAYRTVSEALRHDPDNPEAVAFLETIQAFIRARQPEVQRSPDSEPVTQHLDESHAIPAGSPALPSAQEIEAARARERAAAIDAVARQAHVRCDAGDFNGALAQVEEGLRQWPDADILLEIRRTALDQQERLQQRERAIQELKNLTATALKATPSSAAGELLAQFQNIVGAYPEDTEVQSLAAEPMHLLVDLDRVRREASGGNLQAAMDICDVHLSRFPEHLVFQTLKRDLERSMARALAEEYHRRAATEPDLRKRARILEEAAERCPGETSIADDLRVLRHKLRLIDTMVGEARACEQTGKWDEALEKWTALRAIDEGYPGLKSEIARVKRARDRSAAEAAKRAKELEKAAQAQAKRPQPQNQASREGNTARLEDLASGGPKVAFENVSAPQPQKIERSAPARSKWILAAGGAVAALFAALALFWIVRGPGAVKVNVTSNAARTSITVGGKTCLTPQCVLQLPPGEYTVRAVADGYASVSRPLTVVSGHSSVNLSLTLEPLPELLQVNTNFEKGTVFIDGHSAGELNDGQYAWSGITPGQHTLRVSGQGADFEAVWNSAPGTLPQILRFTSAKDLQATVVANAGTTATISSSVIAQPVTVDGSPAARTAESAGTPVALNALREGARQIIVGDRPLVVDIRSNPALTMFLSLDRDVSTLVVETGEDGVKVFLDNQLYRRTTTHGMLRIPVNAGEHSIRVEKDGFVSPAPQTLALKRGEEKPVSFTLAHAPSYLDIRGAIAGAQVKLDGAAIGQTDRNGSFRHEIAPGAHTIELAKENYTPLQLKERFNVGNTTQLAGARVAMAKAANIPPPPPPPDPKQVEAQEWAQVANSTNPDDFDAFVRSHPGGAHLDQARGRAAELRRQLQARNAQQADQAAWDKVDPNNREQLQEYLSRFPSGAHSQEASARVAELARRAAEALAAQRAKDQKDQGRARQASDEQAVTAALKEFEAAYNRRDIASLQKLWSGVPVAIYRQQFREATDLKFELQVVGPITIEGDSATVACTRTLNYRGQSGGEQTHTERVAVTLARQGAGWVIRSIGRA